MLAAVDKDQTVAERGLLGKQGLYGLGLHLIFPIIQRQ
jgi:hypothetical protein